VAPSAAFDAVFAALHDDLNTPAALGALFLAMNALPASRATPADRAAFEKVMFALGLDLAASGGPGEAAVPGAVADLANRRWEAKMAKDFSAADGLRKELAAAGWAMLDGKEGYKLEPLKKA
jgi:cysteinyl-tRNA synthetase